MDIELKMPKMGESITEGTIINWMIGEGDTFEEGDVLLEVATDKVDNEVPAPVSGRLVKTLFNAKDVVGVGEVIAILSASENLKEKAIATQDKEQVAQKSQSNKPKRQKAAKIHGAISANTNTFFSPLIVSIAKEHHISYEELARIPATGNDGRLRKSDVFNYINDGRPFQFVQPSVQDPTAYRITQLNLDKGTGEIVEMDRMRQMIADHMVYSKQTSPHVTSYIEVDVTNMVNWRNRKKVEFQEKYGEKLTFTPIFVEAVANAIQEYPMINVSVDGSNIVVHKDINIGMATALPSGNLIVPVVKNAEEKNLLGLAKQVNHLANNARNNSLKPEEIQGSTFTISNVGTFGSLMGTPIINQPEVAILALGIIKRRPEVITTEKGDEIAIRSMMYLSLSFDHRVVDGFLGGSFLRKVGDELEAFDSNREI